MRGWFVALVLVSALAASPVQAGVDPPIRAHLKRGVNLEIWLQKPDYDRFNLQQIARDLSELGLDHVRIPVEPQLLHDTPEVVQAKLVDAACSLWRARGLRRAPS